MNIISIELYDVLNSSISILLGLVLVIAVELGKLVLFSKLIIFFFRFAMSTFTLLNCKLNSLSILKVLIVSNQHILVIVEAIKVFYRSHPSFNISNLFVLIFSCFEKLKVGFVTPPSGQSSFLNSYFSILIRKFPINSKQS